MIRRFKELVAVNSKSDFFKSVFTLTTGTALAQLIPLAITPILTRIYSPDDFGLLALYLSTVSIVSILVTGNYEKAIIMPKEDRDAIGIIKLAVFLVVIGCSVILVLTFLFDRQIARFYNDPTIEKLLIFVPLSVFALALYNIINTWFNRRKQYKTLSYNRVGKSTISAVSSIGFGFLRFSAFGLILSEFLGQLLATILFGRRFWIDNNKTFKDINESEVKALAKEHRNFPMYTLPADMLSMASYQLPVFVFAKIFSSHIVGFYSLCIRVLDKPFSLLTTAVYEVFRQKAMEDYNATGSCLEIYKKTLFRLFVIGLPSMTLFFVASPYVFKIIFGSEWEPAGHYARIISIMYFFRFMASPLSFTFYIAKKQKLDFILHIYVFVSSLLVLSVAHLLQLTVEDTLIIFVINYSSIYAFYLLKSYQFAKADEQ